MRTIYLYGQRELIKANVDPDVIYEIGDVLWYDGTADKVYPASEFELTSVLATGQGEFAAVFHSIAAEGSDVGQGQAISVDVSPESVYAVDVPSATYNLDTTLGPDLNVDVLHDQQLEAAVATSSIARSRVNATTTRIPVTFASAFSTRSSNINALLG